MSSMFGGKDPFDDPLFTHPFGSLFGSRMFGSGSSFGDQPHVNRSKAPVIEELDIDGERELEEEGDISDLGEEKDKYNENDWANKNPLVEHPEDQADGRVEGKSKSKEVSYRTDPNKVEWTLPALRSVRFQRVTHGGINGAYYAATISRRTGSDGLCLRKANKQIRLAAKQHIEFPEGFITRISFTLHCPIAGDIVLWICERNVLDYVRGHSYARKLNSDGEVDTMQTLHNLDEAELATFEQAWRGNADSHLPGWDIGFQYTGTGASGHSGDCLGGGRPKKVVTINIE